MRKKGKIPHSIHPMKTYKVVDAYLGGLKQLKGGIEPIELVRVPTMVGSYSAAATSDDYATQVGNTYCYYIGHKPIYREGDIRGASDPIAYEICFHTDAAGVVPIIRLNNVQLAAPEDIQIINSLKTFANQRIAKDLEVPAQLLAYQWYIGILESVGVSISVPADQKRTVAAAVDSLTQQPDYTVATKHGICIDDFSAAVRILDRLGLLFKAPRNLPVTYPDDLNAYLGSVLEEDKQHTIVISDDLEAFLHGSSAKILTQINKALSLFRVVWGSEARTAGEHLRSQLGIPENRVAIEVDEKEQVSSDNTVFEPSATAGPDGNYSFGGNNNDDSELGDEDDLSQEMIDAGYRLLDGDEGELELVKLVRVVESVEEAEDVARSEADSRSSYSPPSRNQPYSRDSRDRDPRDRNGEAPVVPMAHGPIANYRERLENRQRNRGFGGRPPQQLPETNEPDNYENIYK